MSNKSTKPAPVNYRLQLDVLSDGYDGEYCWFHPRAGAIPASEDESAAVVLTMQKFWMPQSDCFFPVHSQQTTDNGQSWSTLVEHVDTLGRHTLPDGVMEGICDFTPKWHAASGKLIGTGHNVMYHPDNKLVRDRRRFPAWSVYEPVTQTWTKWKYLDLPELPQYWNGGAGSTQRVDLENGDILLPIYTRTAEQRAYSTVVLRCRFEDNELRFVEAGNELRVEIERGFVEPSLARYKGKFYLTLRNDLAAYWAVSEDGLHFSTPQQWTFDDGAELGSYNTQAHWVAHSNGLFLTYTRRGANNDHVMRHRAPLFMAQVDPTNMTVLRNTERVLVPEKGAQLGNFAVVDVSERETWVTTSEGMAPGEPQKYGSNGRVYAARILWEQPNTNWNKH
jgi:hypothetical protein